MAAMATAHDRLLCIALGVTSYMVVNYMTRMLLAYREAALNPPTEIKSQYITQEVEDSLKLTTLNKLLDSPNFSIQDTTTTM